MQRLLSGIGGEPSLEDMAAAFPHRLDKVQRRAIEVFLGGASVVVCAPTGAGKTAIAEAAAIAVLARCACVQGLVGWRCAPSGAGKPANAKKTPALAVLARRSRLLTMNVCVSVPNVRRILRARAMFQAGQAVLSTCIAAWGKRNSSTPLCERMR